MGKSRKLTSNEEKVRKKLEDFPQGVKASQLLKELYPMKKTALYEALNGLEEIGLAFRREHSLWGPQPQESPSPPNMKPQVSPSLSFLDRFRLRRAEKESLESERISELISENRREMYARKEKALIPDDLEGPERLEKQREIDRKYGLI